MRLKIGRSRDEVPKPRTPPRVAARMLATTTRAMLIT
jgi:hypothetical protein